MSGPIGPQKRPASALCCIFPGSDGRSTRVSPFSFLLWSCPGSDRRGRTPAGLPVEGPETGSVAPAEDFTFSTQQSATQDFYEPLPDFKPNSGK